MITTMPLSPRVSVVMAVYNGANHLGDCIKSILAQTFENFEFIIIDDCSRDNTLEILKSFNDSRLKIIENDENIGEIPNIK